MLSYRYGELYHKNDTDVRPIYLTGKMVFLYLIGTLVELYIVEVWAHMIP